MIKILGWALNLIGLGLWAYGYFWSGNRTTLFDWSATAQWIAEFLPNIQAEIGMALMIISMIPIYWPTKS